LDWTHLVDLHEFIKRRFPGLSYKISAHGETMDPLEEQRLWGEKIGIRQC